MTTRSSSSAGSGGIESLASDYVDGFLDDRQGAVLGELLRNDADSLEAFVRTCQIHWTLFELARQKALRADALDPAALGDNETRRTPVTVERLSSSTSRRPWLVVAGMALACGLSAIAVVGGWSLWPAPVVAQLSELTPAVAWEGAGPNAGALLRVKETLALAHGRLVVTFVSGAKIVVDGPATFQLTGKNALRLQRGRMTALVPRQAVGFLVETSLGQFVDLGTEFTLQLNGDERCELTVFRGLVEFRPGGGGPLKVPSGRAVSYLKATGEVQVLPYDEEQRLSL